MSYTPSPEHLDRYADLLVNYALGGGQGIAAGDVVLVRASEVSKPLFAAICKTVWRAGGNVLQDYRIADDAEFNLGASFYELAGPDQLDFFPGAYWRGVIDQIDHLLGLFADVNPRALDAVDPELILRNRSSMLPLVEWQSAKEHEGKLSWTVGLYGTPAMAAEAGLTEEEYWGEIIAACFLDDPDPKVRFRQVEAQIATHAAALNALPIDRLHVEGPDVDLRLTLGENRSWIGGGGRNIPSFEIFTSPDWRGTEGWIAFSEPLYAYGKLIKGVRLEFAEGRVIKATADENESLLQEMVATDGADKVGEFSLTDNRLSPITKFMANTLFDENTGGPFGNTHVAIGQSLLVTYDGDASSLGPEDLERLGFNSSVVHTDIVSTTDRTVTATMHDGSTRVIYTGGRFTVPE